MKYQNAQKLIPKKLLNELQEYVNGEFIYIPKPDNIKNSRNKKSASKTYYEIRNSEISTKYANGFKIYDLADEYCLSIDSIRKILNKQKSIKNDSG